MTTATNQDPQNQPYGICWSATEQPSSMDMRVCNREQQSAAPSSGYAIEHSEETTKRGEIFQSEDFLQDLQEEAAAAPAAVATEHSEETTNLPAQKKLTYFIGNAFLNNITFEHPQVQESLVAALKDETCLTRSIHVHV